LVGGIVTSNNVEPLEVVQLPLLEEKVAATACASCQTGNCSGDGQWQVLLAVGECHDCVELDGRVLALASVISWLISRLAGLSSLLSSTKIVCGMLLLWS